MIGTDHDSGAGRIDWEQFRRRVVRIDRAEGGLLGTGFFVAPGWVLTAAHVVADFAGPVALSEVLVTPDRAVGTAPVLADVRARSETPRMPMAIWPFPDLALLQLQLTQDWVNTHPCVWLDPGPLRGDVYHAYGFAPREYGALPVGDPARFVYEGTSGDGLLTLTLGQAPRGLSGAPLLCPVQRAVVGVVTTSKDPDAIRGGWASPVSALLGGDPSVGDPLAEFGLAIREMNRAAVLPDRAAWHRVLPVPAHDVALINALTKPWARPGWEPGDPPAAMLLADANVIPYVRRGDELDRAQRWCEAPAAFAISTLLGRGGAGKSRHAIELGRIMTDRGWIAGLWRPPSSPSETPSVAGVPLSRLIIVDYVEAIAAETLRVLLETLRTQATDIAPARVVLLTRTMAGGADVVREIRKAAHGDLREAFDDALQVPGLATDDRTELFLTAMAGIKRARHGRAVPTADVTVPDLTAARYELPLEVLLEAFDHALSDGTPDTSRPPVDRVIVHEQRHWDAAAPAELDPDLRRAAVALATLAGGETMAEADGLLKLLPALEADRRVRRRTVNWLARLYDGPAHLNPLRPDRLGEALVAIVLQEQDDGGRDLLGRVLTLTADTQVARALDVLARLVASDGSAAANVAAALFDRHFALVERAVVAAQGDDLHPGRLELAGGMQRLLHELAGEMETLARAAPATQTQEFELSTSYTRIADLASSTGQSVVAKALHEHARGIRERLSLAQPTRADYALALSGTHSRLGAIAAAWGEAESARSHHGWALDIRMQLIEADPEDPIRARHVAVSYEQLGDLDREVARARAKHRYQRGLAIREDLCNRYPADLTYARDLSISYERLGGLAAEEGDRAAASRLYQNALAIRERLVNADPASAMYARDLANANDALGRLASTSNVDAFDDAEARFEQALTIRRALARRRPGHITFARDLLVSYHNLAELAMDTGRYGDATRWCQRGLDGAIDLLNRDPRSSKAARDVSLFHHGLARALASDDRPAEAEDHYRRGLEITRELLVKEPANNTVASDLASFHEDLADLLLDAPDEESANKVVTNAAAAVHVRRTLLAKEPSRRDLAEDLAAALWRLAPHADDAPAARRSYSEIIDVLRPFERPPGLSAGGQEYLDRARAALE